MVHSAVRAAALGFVGAGLAALFFAPAATADPASDPCQLAATFLCKLMPVAPDLDHDIDLTQGSATIGGHSMPQLPTPKPGAPEMIQPPDICMYGCV